MTVQKVIQKTGLPVATIARLAGVNEATVWSWLRPKASEAARAPSRASVEKLAQGLGAFGGKLAKLAEELRPDE